jgi:hypothetical protein
MTIVCEREQCLSCFDENDVICDFAENDLFGYSNLCKTFPTFINLYWIHNFGYIHVTSDFTTVNSQSPVIDRRSFGFQGGRHDSDP